MRIKQKPYSLLIITAILLLIAALFSTNSTVNIHVHATYLMIPLPFFASMPSMLLAILWLLYVLTKKYLYSKKLSWIHVLISIIASLFVIVLPYVATYIYAEPEHYKIFSTLTENILTALVILIIAQLLYFVNLCIGLSKGVEKQNLR